VSEEVDAPVAPWVWAVLLIFAALIPCFAVYSAFVAEVPSDEVVAILCLGSLIVLSCFTWLTVRRTLRSRALRSGRTINALILGKRSNSRGWFTLFVDIDDEKCKCFVSEKVYNLVRNGDFVRLKILQCGILGKVVVAEL